MRGWYINLRTSMKPETNDSYHWYIYTEYLPYAHSPQHKRHIWTAFLGSYVKERSWALPLWSTHLLRNRRCHPTKQQRRRFLSFRRFEISWATIEYGPLELAIDDERKEFAKILYFFDDSVTEKEDKELIQMIVESLSDAQKTLSETEGTIRRQRKEVKNSRWRDPYPQWSPRGLLSFDAFRQGRWLRS